MTPATARRSALCTVVLCLLLAAAASAQDPVPPPLTQPVNDFAHVIDANSAMAMETLIRSLEKTSGDAVVVATIETFKPYGDIREYATKMFQNGGRGIGQKGKDNGLLILLAVNDRQVWVEVGYDLEEFITDGFAGETSRKAMAPEFRRGAYGAGLQAGVSRIIGRIAERRNVTLQGVPPPERSRGSDEDAGLGGGAVLFLILLFVLLNIIGRTQRRRRRWGGGSWSGWNSGVGPFGGGFGGGFRGGGGFGGGFGGFGGGGGGFGGFGGGRSGGGGGGASW